MKQAIAVLALPLFLSACGAPQQRPDECRAGHATVVLVRHAEKASDAPDAELSPKGHERAQHLAALLSRLGVTRVLATDVKRTQQTVTPLAEKVGLPVEIRRARETTALIDELRALPDGAVVVVAHHSNGIPTIARALGVEPHGLAAGAEMLPETEFDRVMVVSLGCDRGGRGGAPAGRAKATAVELSSD